MKYLYLYPDLTTKNFSLTEISKYVKSRLPWLKVSLRKDFFLYWLGETSVSVDKVAKKLAGCRIVNLNSKIKDNHVLPKEIEYERDNLTNYQGRKTGILYDGFSFQNVCQEIISREELSLGHYHIIFTNQLLATYDENDRRCHLRTSIYGMPNLISTSGIVEAPAKPKEYYLLKSLGELATEEWKEKNKDKFIDYADPRLTEVLKGYLMQAIFYSLTGNPFCEQKNCRLYNAHWQEELLKAQLNKPRKRPKVLRGKDSEFCQLHKKMLRDLTDKIING